MGACAAPETIIDDKLLKGIQGNASLVEELATLRAEATALRSNIAAKDQELAEQPSGKAFEDVLLRGIAEISELLDQKFQAMQQQTQESEREREVSLRRFHASARVLEPSAFQQTGQRRTAWTIE